MAINLTGEYHTVYAELNGEVPALARYRSIIHIFKARTFRVIVHDVVEHEGTFSINERVKPAQITFVYSKSTFYELNKPRVGIVQLTGDTLKIALGAVGAKAPLGFHSQADSDIVLTVQQRKGFETGSGLSVSRTRRVAVW